MFKNLFNARPRDVFGTPGNLREVLTASTPRAIALWLANTDNEQREQQLDSLDPKQAVALTDLLTPKTAGELLESVGPHTALKFLRELPVATAAGLLDSVDSDDATRIIGLMGEDEAHRVLRGMEYSHSALVRGLLSWPEDSAASRMRPEFLRVGTDANIQQAVEVARVNPDQLEEGVFVTKRTDGGEVLLGWLSPSALVLGKREHSVTSLMIPAAKVEQWSIKPLADQETVAHSIQSHDAQVVPVMDGIHLLGVITNDAVRDIQEEEATEDAERQGGSAPLDIPYLQASPWMLWSKRIGWLLILFVAEMYTGTVMKAFEDEIGTVVALSFFVPLLIGTGGNVGTQITTTLIRAMGQGEVGLRDIGRVLWTEFRTGSLVAIVMGLAGAIRAWTLGVGPEVMLTVLVALACIVLWSSLIASVLPLLIKRIGMDPAVVSGPMIATIVDGTGLLIYFLVARIVISSL